MKTREEHIKAVSAATSRGGWGSILESLVDYAIENGMPVAPELVEPVVGEVLTEDTRLVDSMIVHLPGYRVCAIYNATEGWWDVSKISLSCSPENMGTTWHIAFVPKEKSGN